MTLHLYSVLLLHGAAGSRVARLRAMRWTRRGWASDWGKCGSPPLPPAWTASPTLPRRRRPCARSLPSKPGACAAPVLFRRACTRADAAHLLLARFLLYDAVTARLFLERNDRFKQLYSAWCVHPSACQDACAPCCDSPARTGLSPSPAARDPAAGSSRGDMRPLSWRPSRLSAQRSSATYQSRRPLHAGVVCPSHPTGL